LQQVWTNQPAEIDWQRPNHDFHTSTAHENFMNLTAFFGMSDGHYVSPDGWCSPKNHHHPVFTTQNTLNFRGYKTDPVTFFHGNGLLKTAPDPWRNNREK